LKIRISFPKLLATFAKPARANSSRRRRCFHARATRSGDLPELWSRLVDAVGRVSPFTRGYLIDAHPVSFEKNVLVIGFRPGI
jgi:hypothetical protein